MAEPLSRFIQPFVTATYNGHVLSRYADGDSISVEPVGGEVELTEGTDGSSVNIATDQGIRIRIRLRETSPDHEMLYQQHLSQQHGGPGAELVLYTGTGRTLTASDCFVSLPGSLSTGGKMMGSHEYTFVADHYTYY